MLSNSHWGWPIRPTFWISCLWPYKAYITVNDVFKGTSSEKKNSQDNLLALAYFLKFFTLYVFRSNLPLKKGRSNVTYPVRVRVNVRACTAYLNINILLSLKSNVVHSKHNNCLSGATLKINF
jgi:hypothetical protein